MALRRTRQVEIGFEGEVSSTRHVERVGLRVPSQGTSMTDTLIREEALKRRFDP